MLLLQNECGQLASSGSLEVGDVMTTSGYQLNCTEVSKYEVYLEHKTTFFFLSVLVVKQNKALDDARYILTFFFT